LAFPAGLAGGGEGLGGAAAVGEGREGDEGRVGPPPVGAPVLGGARLGTAGGGVSSVATLEARGGATRGVESTAAGGELG
jgi:hypothetical protein